MQFMLEMKVRGGDEDADHVHAAFNGRIHILLDGPGEGRDLGIQAQVADLFYGIHLARGYNGKAGFYDLDSDLIQSQGNFQLLVGTKDHSRHLLTVAKGYIADLDVERWCPGWGQELIEGVVLHSALTMRIHYINWFRRNS